MLADTSDLPLGAIVLMSDGSQNSAGLGGAGIAPDTLQALRNRRIPVHTVGFGREERAHDVEIEDVSVAEKAFAETRVAATVTLTQHGYVGQKATLTVRDGNKMLASREITFGPDGRVQAEPLFFPAGAAGAKSIAFGVDPLAGEENLANNSLTRPYSCPIRRGKSSTSKASRAGNSNSFAAPKTTIPACRSSPCCAPARTRFIARASAIPTNWPTDFRCGPKISLAIPASSSARSMPTTSLRCSRNCCASMSTGAAAAFSSWADVPR